MQTAKLPPVPRPDHIPAELEVDIDIFNLPDVADDVHRAWKRIQTEHPPVFWTPHNGGHWIATRGEDIVRIQQDHENFTMARMIVPDVKRPFPAPPIELEPPAHGPYRMLISPAFSPKVVAEVEAKVKDVARSLIESIAPRGECEFVTEFTKVLPIVVFLTMMNLPPEDRARLMPHADRMVRSTDPAEITAARVELREYMREQVLLRKSEPRDDLITKILNAKINGEPIPEETVVGMCALLLSGGLDTVKNLLGHCARFLAMHPEYQKQLRDDPALIDNAVEELIRRHGISNTARGLLNDVDFNGVFLKKGDQLQQVSGLVGLDDATVPDPMTVDFSRPAPIPHAAFGNGPHRCPGAILARRELKVFLQEWLPRIKDFRIKPGTKPVLGSGLVNQVLELHLAWDVEAD